MPQFDFYSFYEQVSILLLVFTFYYFFFLRFYLVNFSKTIKMRLKLKNFSDNKNSDTNFKNLFI